MKTCPMGVFPVSQWCADPQFFPGATGLLSETSWQDVYPGSAGVVETLPPPPEHGVGRRRQLPGDGALLPPDPGSRPRRLPDDVAGLRQLLASVSPQEVFLTNAFVGLPDLAGDTESFPTNAVLHPAV